MGTRISRRRREGLCGAADLQEDFSSAEMPRGNRCVPGDQVGLAGELQVERLELSRGVQEERRSFAGRARREGDAAAQELCPGALELVERSGLRRGYETERRVESAGLEVRLGCGERPLRTSPSGRRSAQRRVPGRRLQRRRRRDACALPLNARARLRPLRRGRPSRARGARRAGPGRSRRPWLRRARRERGRGPRRWPRGRRRTGRGGARTRRAHRRRAGRRPPQGRRRPSRSRASR